MKHVRDVMTVDVPRVSSSSTILETAEAMNRAEASGVVVFDQERPVGIITDRLLLRRFIALNQKPGEVAAGDIMGPFYRIGPDASLKEAARQIMEYNITRLGVFDNDKFLGWVSLSDIVRQYGKKNLLDMLRKSDDIRAAEFLCPNCHKAFMGKITNSEGVVLRWECPNCHYSL